MMEPYNIGGESLQIKCSNPDKNSESRPYHNVNLLGMDYLHKFKQVILYQNFEHFRFTLELSNENSKDWKKTRI